MDAAESMQKMFDLGRLDPDALYAQRLVSRSGWRMRSDGTPVRNPETDARVIDSSQVREDPRSTNLGRGGPSVRDESRWPLTVEERLTMTELEQFKRTGWPTPEINLDPEYLKDMTEYWRVPSSEGKFLRDPEKRGIDPDTGYPYEWNKIYEGASLGSPGSVRTLSDKEILAILDEHGWKWGDERTAYVRNIIVQRAESRARRESGESFGQGLFRDTEEYRPLEGTARAIGRPRNRPTTIIGDEQFKIDPETGELISIKPRKK